MKQLRIVLLFVIVATLFPATLLAQEVSPPATIDLLGALAIVREAYGEDIIIVEIAHDPDNACWHFVFEDGTAVCVDETTGEILLDSDTDDGAVDDVDDGAVDDTDDGAVDDTDDGAVDDVDDGAVDDTDDDSVISPTTTLEQAITSALALFPDSSVTSLSLEMLDDGTFAWDIGLDDVLSVDVDATTGEILFAGDEANDHVGTPVGNLDDGAVDDTDDGAVDDVDDGNQGN